MREKFIILIIIILLLPNLCRTQTSSTNVGKEISVELENNATRFIRAYRKHLDLQNCLDQFDAEAFERMRKGKFFQSFEFSEKLISTSKTRELRNAYFAVMNYHFVSLAYEFNDPINQTPKELTNRKSEFRYVSNLLDNGNMPKTVRTKKDLARFISEFEKAAAIYKKSLPSEPFDTKEYLRHMQKEEDKRIYQLDGESSLGVPKGTPVYTLTRDMFNFYFIGKPGHYRVLTLGLE